MDGDPAGGRFLQAANAEQRQGVLQPARTGEAAVRQQAVVTEIDAQGSEDVQAGNGKDDAGPAKELGDKGE